MNEPMKHTIWKYVLPPEGSLQIEIPEDYRILHLDLQNGEICMWAEVEPCGAKKIITVLVRGTGWLFSPNVYEQYIGTVIVSGGKLVWHIYIEHTGIKADYEKELAAR